MARQPIHEGLVVAVIEVIMEAKKIGGLKKRSHSPSNREPGRILKTRKSRSRVTSPEPITSDIAEKIKSERNKDPSHKKKVNQKHITEFYTIKKRKKFI